MQLWLDFLQIESKKTLNNGRISQIKRECNYGQISIKFKLKNQQLWSDLLKFEGEKSLKQSLVFLEKNGFQLSSDFFQIQVKKLLKQRWNS